MIRQATQKSLWFWKLTFGPQLSNYLGHHPGVWTVHSDVFWAQGQGLKASENLDWRQEAKTEWEREGESSRHVWLCWRRFSSRVLGIRIFTFPNSVCMWTLDPNPQCVLRRVQRYLERVCLPCYKTLVAWNGTRCPCWRNPDVEGPITVGPTSKTSSVPQPSPSLSLTSPRQCVPSHWLVCNLNPDPCSSLMGWWKGLGDSPHSEIALSFIGSKGAQMPIILTLITKVLVYKWERTWSNPWASGPQWMLLHPGGEPQQYETLREKRAVDIRDLREDPPCMGSWKLRYRSGHSTYLTTLTCPLTRVGLLPRSICQKSTDKHLFKPLHRAKEPILRFLLPGHR